MAKISVIIPVYNTEEYIDECINSLIRQTYKNIEILLVNDNSGEKCTQLLENITLKDNRIKLFHLQERKGAGAARNLGIQESTGDFIYFMDSDDYLPEKTLQILIDNIKQNNIIRGKFKYTNFSSSMAIIFDGLFKIHNYTDTKYNLLENYFAVNYLIRKDFVLKEGLSFSEDVEVFSDLAFMVPAYIHAEQIAHVKEAIYFKRKRNDPISNPSLSQYDKSHQINDFIFIYNDLKDTYRDKSAIEFLDKQMLNFYRKDIVTYFKNSHEIDTFYERLSNTVSRINNRLINKHSWVLKNEINALSNGIDQYKKVNKRHQLFRDLREGFKSKKKLYTFLYQRVFMKMKMQKKTVFFESFLAKSYSDSPKYIYEHMIDNNMDYKFVWSVKEKKNIPGNPIQVKRFSLRYFYYLARAKYWVCNSRMPKYLDKRAGNVYLQTWHGTPLKTLVFDIEDIYSADPNYKQNFYEQSRRWDYLISPNQYSSAIFRRAFKYDKEMLEFGYPRNDILYKKNNENDIQKIKERLGVPLDKKVILYAPTWRDDEFFSRGNYKFTLNLDLDKMQENFNDEYVVLLRTHYHIANSLDVSDQKGFVYDFSLYDDIAELYLVSDILITDYSSVFFDFAHLKKPILFYTYDIEKYRDELRGFYFNMEEEVPGPLLLTTDEVVNAVENIDGLRDSYKETYDRFYNKFCLWDDGEATKNTVERVFDN
ncbi:bifunctional glycosyltransferase/CDP-glycerol:glycerophosphate glycerophosphotransferase [Virgibacillus salinus]|uniref:CDP-glycerol glycerophosphotransferase n=1 Tax=Virgibacillus salinus TaxID=553311 RepID=A0A1H0YHQ7_9BACI|nr:CDP-glycerol:glycerophosphate glycerophosphotransferase [Virgibacillus salinus]SDQ14436.1 CDP-glycerol glycerophosphotransferase [Virgibacillus salinus]